MQDQQDAPPALQAIDGHHVGGYPGAAHVLTDADNRLDGIELLLGVGMRRSGDVTQR